MATRISKSPVNSGNHPDRQVQEERVTKKVGRLGMDGILKAEMEIIRMI
jgi:hypothetical protein